MSDHEMLASRTTGNEHNKRQFVDERRALPLLLPSETRHDPAIIGNSSIDATKTGAHMMAGPTVRYTDRSKISCLWYLRCPKDLLDHRTHEVERYSLLNPDCWNSVVAIL